jgi:hypothetical protein
MISAVQDKVAAERGGSSGDEAAQECCRTGPGSGTVPLKYYEMLRDPQSRDPRGYIIPSDQPDFLTAIKFVNALIKVGITVHKATAPFAVAGKNYPAGSYVVKAAQAFRPHVMDMFEPQDHPNDFRYPGGRHDLVPRHAVFPRPLTPEEAFDLVEFAAFEFDPDETFVGGALQHLEHLHQVVAQLGPVRAIEVALKLTPFA